MNSGKRAVRLPRGNDAGVATDSVTALRLEFHTASERY
jgi:hypothetical protein